MESRNIVISPCGNKSFLFKSSWLIPKEKKNFDLCLLFYHQEIKQPELYKDVDYFLHLKDFKYHMIHKLLTEVHPEWLNEYDYFYFLDDDIEIDGFQINRMFSLSRAFEISISQASLSKDSFCSWPMFKHQKNSYCRFVGQIEVMAPLFEKEALKKCLPTFIGNRSSWGIDSAWSKILDYPQNKLVVFDCIIMKHTLPVGGGELYQKIGVDPHDEWAAIVQQYHARKSNYREYGRLQIINRYQNRHNFYFYKTKEFFAYLKRIVKDYDVMSRIKSRSQKLLRKAK